MKYNPLIHHRRSIRLPGYDYSQAGFYFVTVCSQGRKPLFGQIVDGHVKLNDLGGVVSDSWEWLAKNYPYVVLDEKVVMPNHLHGIIVITDECKGGSRTAPTAALDRGISRKPLGRLIGAFKTVSTKKINQMRGAPGTTIWQRNYYEHVIRGEDSLRSIREYIVNNPANWEFDKLNIGSQR